VSEVTTTTPDVEVISDDSRVEDQSAFNAAADSFLDNVRKGLAKFTSATNAFKLISQSGVLVRSLILMPNGFPDWSAKSDAYRLAVGDASQEITAKLTADERRRFWGAIRQHTARTYLEPAIVAWVQANVSGMADKDESHEPFKTAVRKQYTSAELAVPAKYQRGTTGNDAPGPGDNPPSPLVAFDNAAAVVKTSTGDMSALGILRMVSELNDAITGKDARYGEGGAERVRDILNRVSVVTIYTSKVLDGKTLTDEEATKLDAAKFDKSDNPAS